MGLDALRNRINTLSQETENLANTNIISEIDSIDNLNQATTCIIKKEINTAIDQFVVAHTLKKVRDMQLYFERYSTFQEYIDNELKFKKVKAYNLIKLAETYPLNQTSREIIEIGISKLEFLAKKINKHNIEQFIKENNVAEVSFRKLKELVSENEDVKKDIFINSENFDENITKMNRKILSLSSTLNDYLISKNEEDKMAIHKKMHTNLVNAKKQIDALIKQFESSSMEKEI